MATAPPIHVAGQLRHGFPCDDTSFAANEGRSATATATKILTFLVGAFYNVTDADLTLFERALSVPAHLWSVLPSSPAAAAGRGKQRGAAARRIVNASAYF